MSKILEKITFFKIFQFHMKVLCKTCVCKFKLYQNSLPHKAYVSKCLHKRLENAIQSFQPNFRKNWNFQNFSKMSKFSLKTHSLKALGFRKSFFGRSCALEINKWCEALSPDGPGAKTGGCLQYVSKFL